MRNISFLLLLLTMLTQSFNLHPLRRSFCKNLRHLSSTTNNEPPKTKGPGPTLLKPTPSNLSACLAHLTTGNLLALPTETVYGLASTLSPPSSSKIFKLKNRPHTSPLIVHVYDYETSLPYVDASESVLKIYKILTDEFWPGPLTIILPSSERGTSRVT